MDLPRSISSPNQATSTTTFTTQPAKVSTYVPAGMTQYGIVAKIGEPGAYPYLGQFAI